MAWEQGYIIHICMHTCTHTCATPPSPPLPPSHTHTHTHMHGHALTHIQPLIPTPCTPGDADLLLQRMCSSSPQFEVFGSVVTTKDFIRSCYDTFQPLLKEKAHEVGSSSVHRLYRSVLIAGICSLIFTETSEILVKCTGILMKSW